MSFTAIVTGTPPNLAAAILGPAQGVRGQALSFTLTANEAGVPSASFSYRINWGDGTASQRITGPSGTMVSHIFAASAIHPYRIQLTATDPVGNSTQAGATVQIASVLLEPDPADSSKTALVIGGTAGNDRITITPGSGAGQILVNINGSAPASFTPTGHILVFGQAGNDSIQVLSNTQGAKVTIPAILFGGTGSSTLSVIGSSADNILIGGSGTNSLTGGAGRDILIGGRGAAILRAGTDDDILIAGRTIFDNNLTALLAVMAEWSRTDVDYQGRVHDLFGNGAGGVNGPYLLDSQTVLRDTALSQLFGGPAMDWFWFSGRPGSVDKLNGYTNNQIDSFE
jgi:Ca2+-binding RTX toxin-like protein